MSESLEALNEVLVEYKRAYEVFRPSQQKLNGEVSEVIGIIQLFMRENKIYSSEFKYSWVSHVYYINVRFDDIEEEGVVLTASFGEAGEQDRVLPFSLFTNTKQILEEEYARFIAFDKQQDEIFKAKRRERLQRELDALSV